MITVTNNSDKQINAALLSIDADIKQLKTDTDSTVSSLKSSIDTTKAGLNSGTTYDISISGNAATASTAVYASTAGSTSTASTAGTAGKVTNSLTITNNGTTYTYDGSSAVSVPVAYVPPVGSYLQMSTDPSTLYLGTTWTNAGVIMTGPNWTSTVNLISYTATWYTVPSAGWVLVSGTDPYGVDNGVYISTDGGTTSKYIYSCYNDYSQAYTKGGSATIPVIKGNYVRFNLPDNTPNRYCMFIPCALELYSWIRTA